MIADAKLRSARAQLFVLAAQIDEFCSQGQHVPLRVMEQLGQASIYAHMVALEVVEFAFKWAGATALKEGNPTGRAMLDIHAVVQHISHDHIWLEGWAAGAIADRAAGV
jgi:hypothetical protein